MTIIYKNNAYTCYKASLLTSQIEEEDEKIYEFDCYDATIKIKLDWADPDRDVLLYLAKYGFIDIYIGKFIYYNNREYIIKEIKVS